MVVIEPATVSCEEEIAEKNIKSIEDGFETASEGEKEEEEEEEEEKEEQSSFDPSKVDDSYEDALTNEQLQQRALDQANNAKTRGNKLFGEGRYEDALSQYEVALNVVTEISSSEEIRSICHANRAVCFSKLGKCEETIKECTKAVELNPTYMKALVRRGEAHEKLEHFDKAIADMKKILELDSSNIQATRAIKRLGCRKTRKDEGRDDREAKGDGKFHIRALWDECGQLQSR